MNLKLRGFWIFLRPQNRQVPDVLQGHEVFVWNTCDLCHYCLCSLHFHIPTYLISFSVAFWVGCLCQAPLFFLPNKLPVATLKPTLVSVDSNHKNLSFISFCGSGFGGAFFLVMVTQHLSGQQEELSSEGWLSLREFLFWDRVSHSPGYPQTSYVAKDDPEQSQHYA